MPKRRATVHPVPGARSTARAIAYLVFDGEEDVNAGPELLRIERAIHKSGADERKKVWAAFRNWLNGLKRDESHHGWPTDPEFRMGYVFRWDHQRQNRRLYGFLVKPRPGLEVCVLCCFRAKEAFRTEPAVKRAVRSMSQHPDVMSAVISAFNRRRRRRKQWTVH